ncbi:MAG: efflux RND transporter periplasmic adaptor subunit [Longimicrobiales bacterium]
MSTLFAMASCSREPATPDGASREPVEVVETHAEEENAIHLNEDMVRDLRISTATVVERPGAGEVTALGEVVADQARYAEVASPTSGQVVRVLVDTNANVSRGTPLAQLRSTDLGRARADLLSAEARRDLARQTLDRKRTLAAERIVALREVQEAEAAFRAADAEVRAATASMQSLGVSGEDVQQGEDSSLFYLRSPIAGRVIDRSVVLGQYAEPSARMFTIADLSRIWVMAQVFERDAVNVSLGTLAHVTVAALPGEEFDGGVALVGRQVDPGSRTVPIRIELVNPGGRLRPGMSASARLEVMGQSRTILAVPAAALQRVGERWLAFIPKAQYEYEMRPVGRGRDLGNDVEVVSGLKAGETVVVEGAFLLKAEAEKRAGGGDEHGH